MAKSAGTDELIFEALERALADPGPRKLHGTKANPGIFLTSSAAAKAAAQRCLEQGLIAVCGEVRSRSKVTPLYGLAPAGITYLLEHDPVRRLLEATQDGIARLAQIGADCQHTLTRIQDQATRLQEVTRDAVSRLQGPDIEKMLSSVTAVTGPAAGGMPSAAVPAVAGPADVPAADSQLSDDLLQHLQQHKRQNPLRPLALPQLFRVARARQPTLRLGAFHDLVRHLAEAGKIRLSPFTQAMYQLAEPECAMIVGREIMYYAECP